MGTALYRKYRPASFSDVSGQEHITKTLKNSIFLGRVSHAYIFTGLRGVGKTSIARIFAKAVNCLEPKKGEACNSCVICKVFNENNAVDLLEIDAASNRGIDEIRDLREKIRFSPNQTKYKVYIIDEVHMLTKEAFNALLKTLEEPPAHAIFILATTEIHKVPDTILSRCQRFDFKRVDLNVISECLEAISKKEKFKCDRKALDLISLEADGSLRDAITLLDQAASFNDKIVSILEVESIVGRADNESLFLMAMALIKGNTGKALDIINNYICNGGDANKLTKGILEIFRETLLYKVSKRKSEKFTNENLEKINNASSEKEIISIMDVFFEAEKQVKTSPLPQLPIELAVIKISMFVNGGENLNSGNENKLSVNSNIGDNCADKWDNVLLEVKSSNHSVHAFLKVADAAQEENEIKLLFPYQFHRERIEDRKNKVIVEKAVERVYGKKLKIKCIIKSGNKEQQKEVKKTSKTDIVAQSINIFGGEIIS